MNSRGRARGVEYIDSEGNTGLVEAELVVLAANGVGTPRLLLASANGKFPNGIANSSDQVKVSADVSAKITKLAVVEGQWVEKGTFLAELDRERQSDVAETDHTDANVVGVEFHVDRHSRRRLLLLPRIQSQ